MCVCVGGVGGGGCYTQTLKKKQEEEQMLLKMTHIQRIYYLIYCITQSQTYNYLIQSDIHSPYIVDLWRQFILFTEAPHHINMGLHRPTT